MCAFVTRGAWILLRPTLLVRDLISVHVLLFLFVFLFFPFGLAIMFSFLSLLWIWRKKAAENTDRVPGTKLHSGIREWLHFF